MERQCRDSKMKKNPRDAGAYEATLARDSQILEDIEAELEPCKPELRISPKTRGQGGWRQVHRQLLFGGSRLRRQNSHYLSTTPSKIFPTNA